MSPISLLSKQALQPLIFTRQLMVKGEHLAYYTYQERNKPQMEALLNLARSSVAIIRRVGLQLVVTIWYLTQHREPLFYLT